MYHSLNIIIIVQITQAQTSEQQGEKLGEDLQRLIWQYQQQDYILDLEKVQDLSAFALCTLFIFRDRVTRSGGRLVACSLQPAVKQLFERCRLVEANQFVVAQNREEAHALLATTT